jgi:hypothetical protein
MSYERRSANHTKHKTPTQKTVYGTGTGRIHYHRHFGRETRLRFLTDGSPIVSLLAQHIQVTGTKGKRGAKAYYTLSPPPQTPRC